MDTNIFTPFFNMRRGLWVNASYGVYGDDVFDTMDIQNLGTADQRLLIWEAAAKECFDRSDPSVVLDGNDLAVIYEGITRTELVAFSQLWVCGLYELLRRVRQTLWEQKGKTAMNRFPEPFHHFDELFWNLEILRMPLAKHRTKKTNLPHTATLMFNRETGSCAWSVYCPKRDAFVELVRREIADEFLRLAPIVSEARRKER